MPFSSGSVPELARWFASMLILSKILLIHIESSSKPLFHCVIVIRSATRATVHLLASNITIFYLHHLGSRVAQRLKPYGSVPMAWVRFQISTRGLLDASSQRSDLTCVMARLSSVCRDTNTTLRDVRCDMRLMH